MLQLVIFFIILDIPYVVLVDLEPVTGIYSVSRTWNFLCSIDMITANSTCHFLNIGSPLSNPDRMDYVYNKGEFRLMGRRNNYYYYQLFQEQTFKDRGRYYMNYNTPPVYAMLTLPNDTVIIAFENSLGYTIELEYYPNITMYGQLHFPTDYALVKSDTDPHIFIYEEDLDTFIVQVQKKGDENSRLARIHLKPVIDNTLQVELLPVVKPLGLLWKYNSKFIGYVNGTFSWVDVISGNLTPFMSLACPGAATIDWGKEQIYHVTICQDKQMLEIVHFNGTNHFQAVNPGLVEIHAIALSRQSAGCSQPCATHDDCIGVCNICRLKQCVDTGECDSYCNVNADCYTCSIPKCVSHKCVR